jgi:hypothetical protein
MVEQFVTRLSPSANWSSLISKLSARIAEGRSYKTFGADRL